MRFSNGHELLCLQIELHRDHRRSVGQGSCNVSSQKECSVKCFPSALAICILLSPRVPPHPKAEITANHLAACHKTGKGVHTCLMLVCLPLLVSLSFTYTHHPRCECVFLKMHTFLCVSQLIRLKLVMMVKVLGCNEARCVPPGYSFMPLGQGFSKESACLTAP